MAAVKVMDRRFFYLDIHARGVVPNYAKKYWQEKGYQIDLSPAEEADLAAGTVDWHRL